MYNFYVCMFNYLEQLRKKPISYRRRVAVLLAAAVTALILLVWLTTLNFGSEDSVDSKSLASDLKPFEEIKTSVVNFYDSVKGATQNLFDLGTSSQEK